MQLGNFVVEPVFIVKVLIVMLIILMAIFNVADKLRIFEYKLVKVMMLLAIIIVMFMDLHTGILLIVVFLLLVIQSNSVKIDDTKRARAKQLEMFIPLLKQQAEKIKHYEIHTHVPSALPEIRENVVCDNDMKKTDISDNILEYQVDTKARPYEAFLQMMTTKDQLDMASNSAYLY